MKKINKLPKSLKRKKQKFNSEEKPKIDLPFDYGNIKDDHKALVKDIILRLEKNNQTDLIQDLKVLFKIEESEKYNIEESVFYQYCKKVNVPINRQGTITELKNGKNIEYPIISVCDDVRKLNSICEKIIEIALLNKK
jgi:hypothetical protein